MNKLNNKGMTIVELIVSFVMLMVLVLGMLNMTNEIKTTSREKQFYKELNEYSSLVQSTIQDDLILKRLVSVVKDESNCTKGVCYKLTFKDGVEKKLIVNEEDKIISYDEINYIVPMKDYINDSFNTDQGTNLVNVSFEDNMFIFDFPIYEDLYGDGKTNFGFKIVHLTEAGYR